MWPGKPDIRHALFGGVGTVRVWDLGAGATAFEAVLGCALAAGGSVGPHAQETADELVIVIEGTGTARVDGAPQPLKPGAVVCVPLGAVLELKNRSKKLALRYLIVKTVRST